MTLSIDRRAALWGDRTAIVDVSEERLYAPAETIERDRLSYAALATATDRTAGALADAGIEPGDVVGVLSRNRAASLAVFFACRRLGATIAPISHRLTPATVHRPLDRLDPAIVVHESAQRDLVRELPPARQTTFAALADESADRPADANGAADDRSARDVPLLALHGDEGAPVVAFSERAVEANCVAAVTTWGYGARDRAPLLVPLSSDDGLLRIALPLLYTGATLLVDRAFDPVDTLEAVERERATLLAGREMELRELVDRSGFDAALESISLLVAEGPIDESVTNAYLERGVRPARATGWLECPNALATVADGGGDASAPLASDRGGRPVLDCRARLLGDGETDVDARTLQLAGPMLADGYLNPDGNRHASRDGDDRRGDGDHGRDAGDEDEGPGQTGQFVDGWFDTGEAFERDESGAYRRR